MTKCNIQGCKRQADGEVMFRNHEVCMYHESKHWRSNGTYIWNKLGLEPSEKETQLTL